MEVDNLHSQKCFERLGAKPPGDLKLFRQVFQPPRAVVGNDPERRGAVSPAVDMEGGRNAL